MSTGLANSTSFFPFPVMGAGEGKRDDRRAEYLLVIFPYGDLKDKLLEEQQQFSTDYGLQRAAARPGGTAGPATGGNRPHITVAAFQAGEMMENTLIRWIQRICNRHRSFTITLNNYSGIPPHTIYLRVQDPQPFRDLMSQLRAIDDFIRSSGCPPVNLVNRPYLSIAGGLTEQLYNRAMPDYSRRCFHESFHVEELVLLKRKHSFDPCKIVNIFRLLPESSEAWSVPDTAAPHPRTDGLLHLNEAGALHPHATERLNPQTPGLSGSFPA